MSNKGLRIKVSPSGQRIGFDKAGRCRLIAWPNGESWEFDAKSKVCVVTKASGKRREYKLQ